MDKITNININKIVNLSRDTLVDHHLAGRVQRDTWTIIAKVHVKADDGYVFRNKPRLIHRVVSTTDGTNTRDFLDLVFLSRTKDTDGLVTDYYFNLIYKNDTSTSLLNDIKVKISYNAILKTNRSISFDTPKEITSIEYGNSVVQQEGGQRLILVKGVPGSKFELTFNRKSIGHSILNTSATHGSYRIDPVVGRVESIVASIPKNSSYYTFSTNIPSTTVRSTLVQGGFSNVNKVIFDNLESVIVGDRLYSPEIPKTTVVTVSVLDPDGDKFSVSTGYEVQLSSNVTLTNNKSAIFKRSDQYDINVYGLKNDAPHENKTTITTKLPTTIPKCSIYQYLDPVLTISATTGDTDYSAPASVAYVGRPNASAYTLRNLPDYSGGKQKSNFQISWVLDASGAGGKTFTLVKNPVFSSASQASSDFTNSVSSENGGTKVVISKLNLTGAGTDTVTITANVNIVKFGNSNVTMNLDLDNIVAI